MDGWSCACKELDITDLVTTGDGEEGFMQEVALLERLPYHPYVHINSLVRINHIAYAYVAAIL